MKRSDDSKITSMLLVFSITLMFAAGSAKADFTFGEPMDVESVLTVLDGAYDAIDCFSRDGLEMFIDSNRSGGYGDYDIYVLRRDSQDAEWGPPENLGSAVNGANQDSFSCISGDGLTLFFGSNRPGGYGNFDIYRTTRATKNDPWGKAENMGPNINSSATDSEPWISPDGLEFYFESYRAGGFGRADIYVAKRATPNDPWGAPVNLGSVVNSAYWEQWLSLSPDGLLLLFSDHSGAGSFRPGGHGRADMWLTRRADLSAPWQSPVNLGPTVNGSAHDGAPRLSLDGHALYFWSDRSGGWGNYQAPVIPIVDFNGDGSVDGNDMLWMAASWGTDDPLCDIGPFPWGDGTVDLPDLVVLAEYLGKEFADPTLLAHWALDESEGAVAGDSVGGAEAYVFGGPAWRPDGGQVGGAIELDGVDDCVVARFALDPSAGPFSVLAWVQGGASGQVVISEPTAANWLMADAEGKLRTELRSSSRLAGPLQSQTIITDGQWHRIGLAWDGSRRMLYVDGVVAAEDTQDALPKSGNGLQIGTGKAMEPGSFYSGLIDDVRIYSRAVKP